MYAHLNPGCPFDCGFEPLRGHGRGEEGSDDVTDIACMGGDWAAIESPPWSKRLSKLTWTVEYSSASSCTSSDGSKVDPYLRLAASLYWARQSQGTSSSLMEDMSVRSSSKSSTVRRKT
jgi:hypothetical protein